MDSVPDVERTEAVERDDESHEGETGLVWDEQRREYEVVTPEDNQAGRKEYIPHILTSAETTHIGTESGEKKGEEVEASIVYVEFEEGDPQNPFNWPR
jgi:hypothetical protein